MNLSFCGLKTETIWKFFQNNFGLLNLVSLNLSYNFISNSFFSLCAGQDILLEKLKIIDLSRNDIHCKYVDDLEKVEIFINNYQELNKKNNEIQQLLLQNNEDVRKIVYNCIWAKDYTEKEKNEFIEELIDLYNNKKEEINAIIDKLKSKEIKFFVETDHKSNIIDKLNDIIDYKDKI